MDFSACALGVVQQRGRKQITPQSMNLGAAEAQYFMRHVQAVRRHTSGTPTATVAAGSMVLGHLKSLSTTTDDDDFVDIAKRLQDSLSRAMQSTGTAKDCVFAVLRFFDSVSLEHNVTILKLDAIIEAAQWQMLANRVMDFKVLTDLLPEPGNLQKGLSWPDPRSDSEIMTIDRNSINAQYFEKAFDLLVSPRAKDAEAELLETLTKAIPAPAVASAIASVESDAPLDEVLEALTKRYPELSTSLSAVRENPRPAGRIRADIIAGRPIIWEADGIQVKVPSALFDRVETREGPDGWEITVRVSTEPKLRPG